MPSSTQNPRIYTLYTSPSFLYPRRIHAYLTTKPLPPSISITHTPIAFAPDGTMTAPPGKIPGSIPMLRYGSGSTEVIRQSVAIVGWLEDTHPRGLSDMRGSTPLERARVAEIIAVVEEATQAFGFWAANGSKLYAQMGLAQNQAAGEFAKGRMDKSLQTIWTYSGENVESGKWIAGTEELSLADICLGCFVEYARDMYKKDVLGGEHTGLEKWFERWESTEAGKPGEEKIPWKEFGDLAGEWKW